MLTDRQKLILKAIIEDYVSSNEPIGSKALTEKPYLDFSSATIRYDMQSLEENGYLEKTHTSSGRIPSETGYRYYVDHLIIRDESVLEYFKYLDDIFDNRHLAKEDALKKIADFLSELTGYYSIILGSSADFAKVMKMEIVPLSNNEAVMLIVTNTGQVQSQKITIPEGYNQDDLLKIIQMFDNAMYGHSVFEIREILSKEAAKPRIRQMVDFKDDILNFMIKGFSRFLNTETYDSGLSRLFNQPEFQDYQIMQKILKAVDEEALIDFAQASAGNLKINIGRENVKGLEDCSIVTIPYYIDDNEYGTIILVGPTRMNYRGVVPLLEYVAKSMPKLYNR
ncbi:MAG: heat-inducible transcriptional repressor HrcA [Anaeroplasmataceae bacterium]|jgi:heat shock gene repressor HrcA|nr:heat-inducible transcriptional repressor HrcA [Anaeroplasmataceae bacterium]HRF70423.1 heat-inducible transcriptional repressor HrcA [Candidatus Pelethenecus sp.]